MRAILALSLTLAALSAQAQKLTYDATQGGKKIGTLTFERKPVGANLRIAYTINVQQNGQTGKFDVVNMYDGKGYPKSKQLIITSQGSDVKLLATFTGMKAKVVATIKGKTQSRDLQAPKQSPLTDASVWWFIKSTPKVGEMLRYQTLNLMNGSWSESTTKYVGPGTVQHKGKAVKGHQMITDQGAGNQSVMWLDDKGMPIVLEQNGVKFVRR